MADANGWYVFLERVGPAKPGDAEGQESLQAEPDVDRDDRGLTSLHLAAENGSAEVSQLLVANPGAIHAQTKRGRTPLHGAAAHGQVPTLQLLLASDAVVNAADVLGTTALHLAVTHGSIEAVEVLLDHHADLRSADLFGQQPLHYAARHGLAAVVQVLLARGADAAAQDASNKTARDLAQDEEVAELLSWCFHWFTSIHFKHKMPWASSSLRYLGAYQCNAYKEFA